MSDYENSSVPELIRRARRGDRKAFSELYSQCYTDMYRFAFYLLGSSHDAEDAVSDAVIAAYEGIARLRKEDSFRSWIFTILSNRCMKILRERNRAAVPCPTDDPLRQSSGQRDLSGTETDLAQKYAGQEMVRQALAILEETERMIVVFSVFGGYSSEEIGKRIEMNAATVRSRKRRAIGKMRRFLEDEERPSV